MFQIYDDLAPKQYQEELNETILSRYFPWHYQDQAVAYDTNVPSVVATPPYKDTTYFQHTIFRPETRTRSQHFELVRPLIHLFQARTGYEVVYITRIIANLLLPTNEPVVIYPHVDKSECTDPRLTRKTLLYYLHDSDGDTLMFDNYFTGEKTSELKLLEGVTPKQGRGVVFDSFQYHAATTPIKNRRVVINVIMDVVK